MVRTTIMLPGELKHRATTLARKRGVSFGELLREALAAAVNAGPPARATSVFDDDAVWRGRGPSDLAAEHDRYLYGDGDLR